MRKLGFAGAMLWLAVQPATAQDTLAKKPKTISDAQLMEFIPDPGSVTMPNLDFQSSAEIEADFDKYFYFNRQKTTFAEALTDLRECDNLARGLSSGVGYQQAYYPYAGTVGGVIGSAIGNALSDAIYGSAERRKRRRANMQVCMFYKGYQRYGLSKPLWEEFNFEEGNSTVKEDKRQAMLAQQAKVASGPRPTAKEIGQ